MQSQPTRQTSYTSIFEPVVSEQRSSDPLQVAKNTLQHSSKYRPKVPAGKENSWRKPLLSYLLNVQHLNTVLNCSGRGQFVRSSSIGAQSGIFKVSSDINYPLCNCKTADTLSQLANSSSTNFSVGYGDVVFFTLHRTTWDPKTLATKARCPHFIYISVPITLSSQRNLF